MLLLSLEHAASGSNLTAANHVIFVHPMNAETLSTAVAYERQALARVRRVGQERPEVHVWRFVTRETVEEHMHQFLALYLFYVFHFIHEYSWFVHYPAIGNLANAQVEIQLDPVHYVDNKCHILIYFIWIMFDLLMYAQLNTRVIDHLFTVLDHLSFTGCIAGLSVLSRQMKLELLERDRI